MKKYVIEDSSSQESLMPFIRDGYNPSDYGTDWSRYHFDDIVAMWHHVRDRSCQFTFLGYVLEEYHLKSLQAYAEKEFIPPTHVKRFVRDKNVDDNEFSLALRTGRVCTPNSLSRTLNISWSEANFLCWCKVNSMLYPFILVDRVIGGVKPISNFRPFVHMLTDTRYKWHCVMYPCDPVVVSGLDHTASRTNVGLICTNLLIVKAGVQRIVFDEWLGGFILRSQQKFVCRMGNAFGVSDAHPVLVIGRRNYVPILLPNVVRVCMLGRKTDLVKCKADCYEVKLQCGDVSNYLESRGLVACIETPVRCVFCTVYKAAQKGYSFDTEQYKHECPVKVQEHEMACAQSGVVEFPDQMVLFSMDSRLEDVALKIVLARVLNFMGPIACHADKGRYTMGKVMLKSYDCSSHYFFEKLKQSISEMKVNFNSSVIVFSSKTKGCAFNFRLDLETLPLTLMKELNGCGSVDLSTLLAAEGCGNDEAVVVMSVRSV